MTVQELIEKLQTLDPNKRVVISGYESGCDDINVISTMWVRVNKNNMWYYGKHEFVFWPEEEEYDEEVYLLEYRNK